MIRARVGVVNDPERARATAAGALREAALVKNNPPDLINVALDFAGEAAAADAGVMRDYADTKRIALMACLLHSARARARDDLAEMFCKRVAAMTKAAKQELEAIRERQRAITERRPAVR